LQARGRWKPAQRPQSQFGTEPPRRGGRANRERRGSLQGSCVPDFRRGVGPSLPEKLIVRVSNKRSKVFPRGRYGAGIFGGGGTHVGQGSRRNTGLTLFPAICPIGPTKGLAWPPRDVFGRRGHRFGVHSNVPRFFGVGTAAGLTAQTGGCYKFLRQPSPKLGGGSVRQEPAAPPVGGPGTSPFCVPNPKKAFPYWRPEGRLVGEQRYRVGHHSLYFRADRNRGTYR